MKKKKGLIALVAMLGIVLITAGATYAWFSYSKSGTKENTISSGAITFHYEEGTQGLSLNDAMPMTDEYGMKQNKYFDFTITSKTSNTVEIPYDITVKRSGTGTNMDNVVKVYLTKVDNNVETPVEIVTGKEIATVSELSTYLNSTLNIDASKNERKLTTETVPAGSNNYSQAYRLRMWISTDANFSLVPAHCSDSTYTTQEACVSPAEWIEEEYPYNNKTYTLKVNVYGEGSAIGDSRLAPGLYDSNGDLVTSWDDLISNGDITVNNNVITNSNKNLVGNLVIKRGITGIGDVAFSFAKLTGIDIPSTLTSIRYSFPGTPLENIVVEDGNPVYDSRNDCNSVIETATNTLVLGSANTVIPTTVTTIGDNAFNRNAALTSLVIPDNVTTINGSPFYACSNLSTVTLSNNLTRIDGIFTGCNISSITIPASVEFIGNRSFSGNPLTSVTFVDPYGWTASYYIGSKDKDGPVPSAGLSDPATAASYLTSSDYYLWYDLSKESSQ